MDERKLERLLEVMLWLLFDLKNRTEVILEALPETERHHALALRHTHYQDLSEAALRQFFRVLRGLAGLGEEATKKATDVTSEELWRLFRTAELREGSATVFAAEWRGLWDVL